MDKIPFGEILLQNLKDSSVSVSNIIRDPEYHTGTVSILVDAQGENTMVADFSSNLQLCPDDIEKAADSIRKADLLLLQCEVSESANLCALSIAKDAGVPVIINPAPIIPSSLDMLKGTCLSAWHDDIHPKQVLGKKLDVIDDKDLSPVLLR